MATDWKSEEFVANETIVGHGRELVTLQMCAFLNENNIKPGNFHFSCYEALAGLDDKRVACGLLIYRK